MGILNLLSLAFYLAALSSTVLCSPALALDSQSADWPFDVTEISAPDGSITAKFVSVGATMTELWVKDKHGEKRDVILGYDDNTRLLTDPDHPVFNAIVGRYANRIKNGTFSIPITKTAQPPGPNVYQIPTNDHDGQVTLHGGIIGWDRRNWTVLNTVVPAPDPAKRTSVTYKHVDDADEGFPGRVEVFATHEVSNGGVLKTTVRATASEKTPIMVTQHVYWNLDAFKDGKTTVLDYQASIDASRVVKLDGDAIPTGELMDLNAAGNKDGLFDFKKPRTIGKFWNQTVGLCGGACQGYDHAWIYDHDETKSSGTSFYSDASGIRLDISTNQPSVQMYTAYWLNTPRKLVHGGPSVNYTSWSGVAVEQQGWVDAINTPEWGVDQIYGPGDEFEWSTTYKFSTVS